MLSLWPEESLRVFPTKLKKAERDYVAWKIPADSGPYFFLRKHLVSLSGLCCLRLHGVCGGGMAHISDGLSYKRIPTHPLRKRAISRKKPVGHCVGIYITSWWDWPLVCVCGVSRSGELGSKMGLLGRIWSGGHLCHKRSLSLLSTLTCHHKPSSHEKLESLFSVIVTCILWSCYEPT